MSENRKEAKKKKRKRKRKGKRKKNGFSIADTFTKLLLKKERLVIKDIGCFLFLLFHCGDEYVSFRMKNNRQSQLQQKSMAIHKRE